MANRDDLRARLKAADKRRQRRAIATPDAQVPQSSAMPKAAIQSEALGAIVETVLAQCAATEFHLDAVAVGALRGCLKHRRPTRDQAAVLYDRLAKLAEERQLPERAFRDAISHLLDSAQQYDGGNPHDTRFLEYLSIIAQ